MKTFFTKIWNWIKGLFSKKEEQVIVPAPKKKNKTKKLSKTTKKGK